MISSSFRKRPPRDKIWWGQYNRPFSPEKFSAVYARLQAFLQDRDLFVQDCYVGADPNYQLPIRVITEYAWHSLFARNMFIRIDALDQLKRHVPEFTIIAVPSFQGVPSIDGTLTPTFILLNFEQKLVIIGGSGYGGEIKKSAFTILNYLLPLAGCDDDALLGECRRKQVMSRCSLVCPEPARRHCRLIRGDV